MGVPVEVAVMRPGGIREAELHSAGVPVHVFPCRSFLTGLPAQWWKLGRFLRHRFEVVHSFDMPSNILAVPAARAAGVPMVLSSQRAHRELAPPWMRPLLRLTDRLSHGVVVYCRFVEDHLAREEGVGRLKIHLIYNGLEGASFQPAGPRAAVPFPPDSLVVGCVCALREEKGLPVLLEAFARLTDTRARLLIVGSGPLRMPLEEQARRLNITSRIHFEPSVPDTAPWLRAIDIFVLPSRSEAFSNSIMEAMACGAVVVASRVGGNPELVSEDESRGLLFERDSSEELAAQIGRLAEDPERRAGMAAQAAEWVVRELDVSQMCRRLAGLYGGNPR